MTQLINQEIPLIPAIFELLQVLSIFGQFTYPLLLAIGVLVDFVTDPTTTLANLAPSELYDATFGSTYFMILLMGFQLPNFLTDAIMLIETYGIIGINKTDSLVQSFIQIFSLMILIVPLAQLIFLFANGGIDTTYTFANFTYLPTFWSIGMFLLIASDLAAPLFYTLKVFTYGVTL
ncbi:hypothetical protein FGO68_gene3557 [Halteria grandinella]|uniref:Uncharacterized protein n=1 Tax=Halteria grandinella TaxID=5974 RepID=A0A8J8NIS6_HALGN|nr:hypothetical protein FGO68_gene3557 [Halteria grandinella]